MIGDLISRAASRHAFTTDDEVTFYDVRVRSPLAALNELLGFRVMGIRLTMAYFFERKEFASVMVGRR
jgi:hypothetical protein